MSHAEDRAQVNEVTVLAGFVRMIVNSDLLPSTAADRLAKDVAAIPARFAAVKAADARRRRSWKTKKER